MPYRVALTSSEHEKIDLHFGHTSSFRIFEIDEKDGSRKFLEERTLEPASASCSDDRSPVSGCGHNDERLAAVVDLLSGCAYILTTRIGPKPQAFLKRFGITALESPPELSAAILKLNVYHVKYAEINREK
jgi:predicted Fe-Mo cluster-binding NifX family protein